MGTRKFRHEHESETSSVPRPYLAWSLYATALTAVVAPDSVTADQPLLT